MLYFVPPIASAVLLALTWENRRRPILCLAWLAGAAGLQFLSHVYSPTWAIGLVLQVILALYLAIRFRVD